MTYLEQLSKGAERSAANAIAYRAGGVAPDARVASAIFAKLSGRTLNISSEHKPENRL